jgi:hypothetical protein
MKSNTTHTKIRENENPMLNSRIASDSENMLTISQMNPLNPNKPTIILVIFLFVILYTANPPKYKLHLPPLQSNNGAQNNYTTPNRQISTPNFLFFG